MKIRQCDRSDERLEPKLKFGTIFIGLRYKAAKI